MITTKLNQLYVGAENRESLIDLYLPEKLKTNAIVLFIHGYKGYKDWGCWNLVAHYFAERGIGFCKLNLSHNGGTTSNPIDFPDLEAFGTNRYTYEVEDIKEGIDWLQSELDTSDKKIFLLGHSRGGGDALLAGQDERVHGIITWASISDIEARFPTGKDLKKWEELGVRYVENSRTKQQMPHYFSFYQDWFYNQDFLHIEKAAKSLEKPCFHIHGDQDMAVSLNESKKLSQWTKGKCITLTGANHTFGASHPWNNSFLPKKLEEACLASISFIASVN